MSLLKLTNGRNPRTKSETVQTVCEVVLNDNRTLWHGVLHYPHSQINLSCALLVSEDFTL